MLLSAGIWLTMILCSLFQLKSKEEIQKESKVEEEKKLKAKFDSVRNTSSNTNESNGNKSSQEPPKKGD